MVRSRLAWLVACLLACSAAGSAAEAPAEPSPEALVQAWFEQLFGANTVEVWESEWAGAEWVLEVARRWQNGRPELFLHIQSPRHLDELNFLLRDRDASSLELLYYRSPRIFPRGQKAARVMLASVPSPIGRLPFGEGLPTLAELQPPRPTDYTYTRLPDQRVANRPCRVIEGRPVSSKLDFDRVHYSLSRETGVALETAWFRAETLVRRIEIAPSDIRDHDGRLLPTQRSVETPGSGTQVYRLRRLMIDPPLPDQLFTTQNLKAGRFPSY